MTQVLLLQQPPPRPEGMAGFITRGDGRIHHTSDSEHLCACGKTFYCHLQHPGSRAARAFPSSLKAWYMVQMLGAGALSTLTLQLLNGAASMSAAELSTARSGGWVSVPWESWAPGGVNAAPSRGTISCNHGLPLQLCIFSFLQGTKKQKINFAFYLHFTHSTIKLGYDLLLLIKN